MSGGFTFDAQPIPAANGVLSISSSLSNTPVRQNRSLEPTYQNSVVPTGNGYAPGGTTSQTPGLHSYSGINRQMHIVASNPSNRNSLGSPSPLGVQSPTPTRVLSAFGGLPNSGGILDSGSGSMPRRSSTEFDDDIALLNTVRISDGRIEGLEGEEESGGGGSEQGEMGRGSHLDEGNLNLPSSPSTQVQPVVQAPRNQSVLIYEGRLRTDEENSELRRFADSLRDHYGLTSDQTKELKGLIYAQLYRDPGALKDSMLHYAAGLRTYNLLLKQSYEREDLTEFVNTALSQLAKDYTLSKPCKNGVRLIARDVISQPTCASFDDAHKKVWDVAQADPAVYGLTELFGSAIREAALKKACKTLTDDMLQQLREDVQSGIIKGEGKGKNANRTLSLEEASAALIDKYRKGGLNGITAESSNWYQLRMALLRRFAREECCDEEGSVLKKRKVGSEGGGRVAKDEAFWGRFAAYLSQLKTNYTANMSDPLWIQFFGETVAQDWKRFGEPGNLLPPLPLTITGGSPGDAAGNLGQARVPFGAPVNQGAGIPPALGSSLTNGTARGRAQSENNQEEHYTFGQ